MFGFDKLKLTIVVNLSPANDYFLIFLKGIPNSLSNS